MRGFGSDNHAPVHPAILKALSAVNEGHAPSYGTDSSTTKAQDLFRKLFAAPEADVHFVFNGTGANIVALRALVKPWQSVLCSEISHIAVDECGGPEALGGFKLQTIPAKDGKLTIEELNKAFIRRGDQHYSQAAAISITQPTEIGTVYSLSELSALCEWARQRKLFVHIDGARIANAVVSLETSFEEMFTRNQIDIISFGGTKNGLMMGEALIVLNKSLANDIRYIRKQSAQLPSKTRYIAAQFCAYLEGELWREIANNSISKALELHTKLKETKVIDLRETPRSNAVFAVLPKDFIKPLKDTAFFYVWDEQTLECRLMTSWDTRSEEIDLFVNKLKELQK